MVSGRVREREGRGREGILEGRTRVGKGRRGSGR